MKKRISGGMEVELQESNIGLVLNSYDEIFSGFDPRGFSERALSDDFLGECKRAATDKEKKIELRFLVPREKRSSDVESKIRKRLKNHFKRHLDLIEGKRKKIFNQGMFFVFFGILFMLVAAYVLFYYNTHNFFKELLVVLLEPGGWFLFWQGLDLIIFRSKEVSLDLSFYRKMANSEIFFLNY